MLTRAAFMTVLVLLASPARAELRKADLDGITVGMTRAEVLPLLRASQHESHPDIVSAPCHSGASTCIAMMSAGNSGNITHVYFVEDLPAAPDTSRVYAVLHSERLVPWFEGARAEWDAQTLAHIGAPDCVDNDPMMRTRAWSAAGAMTQCADRGADLVLPEAENTLGMSLADIQDNNRDSPLTFPLVWEQIGDHGRFRVRCLIDLGYKRTREQAGAGASP